MTKKCPFHPTHLQRVKNSIDSWTVIIKSDLKRLGEAFKELVPDRDDNNSATTDESQGDNSQKPSNGAEERKSVITSSVLGVAALVAWFAIATFNLLVVAQIMDVWYGNETTLISIQWFGEFSPVSILIAVIFAILAAAFGFGLHWPSKIVRVFCIIFSMIIVAAETLGGYWRGVMLESYDYASSGSALLGNMSPLINALIGFLAPSAEIALSYMILKGIGIAVNFNGLLLVRLIALWLARGILSQYYGHFLRPEFLAAIPNIVYLDKLERLDRDSTKAVEQVKLIVEAYNSFDVRTKDLTVLVDNFIGRYSKINNNGGEPVNLEFSPSSLVRVLEEQFKKLRSSELHTELDRLTSNGKPEFPDWTKFPLATLRQELESLIAEKELMSNYLTQLNKDFIPMAESAFTEASEQLNRNRHTIGLILLPDTDDQAIWDSIRRERESLLRELSRTTDDPVICQKRIREILVDLNHLIAGPMIECLDPNSKSENLGLVMRICTRLGCDGSMLRYLGNLQALFDSDKGTNESEQFEPLDLRLQKLQEFHAAIMACYDDIDRKIGNIRDNYFRLECRDVEPNTACTSCTRCSMYKFEININRSNFMKRVEEFKQWLESRIDSLEVEINHLKEIIASKQPMPVRKKDNPGCLYAWMPRSHRLKTLR